MTNKRYKNCSEEKITALLDNHERRRDRQTNRSTDIPGQKKVQKKIILKKELNSYTHSQTQYLHVKYVKFLKKIALRLGRLAGRTPRAKRQAKQTTV